MIKLRMLRLTKGVAHGTEKYTILVGKTAGRRTILKWTLGK
jgi:hypothetical protein